jgi:transcription antitermination factor NusG
MPVAGSQRMRSKPLVTGEWHKAVILPSVVGIVRSGSPTPGAVLEAAIAEIRRREAEAVAKPEPTKLKPGAIERIKEGPLDDRLGLCTSVRAATVMVLLSMFGAERKIRFDPGAVEAV